MELNNEEQVMNALGVNSLVGLPREKVVELSAILPNLAPDVQARLIEVVPELQANALEAVKAMEEILEVTLKANEGVDQRLSNSLSEVRELIAGRLNRDDISEAHAEYLVEKLMETTTTEAENAARSREFQAAQANATRFASLIQAGLPLITALAVFGGRLVASRGTRL